MKNNLLVTILITGLFMATNYISYVCGHVECIRFFKEVEEKLKAENEEESQ